MCWGGFLSSIHPPLPYFNVFSCLLQRKLALSLPVYESCWGGWWVSVALAFHHPFRLPPPACTRCELVVVIKPASVLGLGDYCVCLWFPSLSVVASFAEVNTGTSFEELCCWFLFTLCFRFQFWQGPYWVINHCYSSLCLWLHLFVISGNRYNRARGEYPIDADRNRAFNFNLWAVESITYLPLIFFCAGGQRFGVWDPVAEKSASWAHCSVLRLSEGSQWEDPHYFHGVHAGGE